jgi:hypothetical protein
MASFLALAATAASTLRARAGHRSRDKALRSLVDAELRFARMGLEQGIPRAFIANFARTASRSSRRPCASSRRGRRDRRNPIPKALKLEWQPEQAGIAKSLDMGFTTGRSSSPTRHATRRLRTGVLFRVAARRARRVESRARHGNLHAAAGRFHRHGPARARATRARRTGLRSKKR